VPGSLLNFNTLEAFNKLVEDKTSRKQLERSVRNEKLAGNS
jgi:hypothetical protein